MTSTAAEDPIARRPFETSEASELSELSEASGAPSTGVYVLDTRLRVVFANEVGLHYLGLLGGTPGARLIGGAEPEFGIADFDRAFASSVATGTISSTRAFVAEVGRWFDLTVYPVVGGTTLHLREVADRDLNRPRGLPSPRASAVGRPDDAPIADHSDDGDPSPRHSGTEPENSRNEPERTVSGDLRFTGIPGRVDAVTVTLSSASVELDATNVRLEATNVQLDSTNLQLDRRNIELDATTVRLDAKTVELTATHVQLDESIRGLHRKAELLDAATDAIYVCELDGAISYWNRGAEVLYGWTADEAIGERAIDLLYSDPRDYEEKVDDLLARGVWNGELEEITKNGAAILVEGRFKVVRDIDDEPSFILGVVSDITMRKKMVEKAYRAERMESLGTLAGGIAHDLNNVLTPILIATQLLLVDEREAGRRDLLSSVETSVKRGAEMIREVLTFASGEETERSAVDVEDLLEGLRTFCVENVPPSVVVRFEVAPRLWTVLGDRGQILRILINLVINARDVLGDGGSITIRARNAVAEVGERGASIAEHLVLEVEDTGPGMTTGVALRVFEPFFTTKDVGQGTGLGLSTSIAIARGHGGDMEVFSQLGRGTLFQLTLPRLLQDAPPAPPIRGPVTPESMRGHGERVLVVDDEQTIRTVVTQMLEANGYRTLAVANGLEAVRVISSGEVAIDVVFTDMMMPEMDGAALASYLRANNPELPLVVASGVESMVERAHAAHSAIAAFLIKPFTTLELLRAVQDGLK